MSKTSLKRFRTKRAIARQKKRQRFNRIENRCGVVVSISLITIFATYILRALLEPEQATYYFLTKCMYLAIIAFVIAMVIGLASSVRRDIPCLERE